MVKRLCQKSGMAGVLCFTGAGMVPPGCGIIFRNVLKLLPVLQYDNTAFFSLNKAKVSHKDSAGFSLLTLAVSRIRV
jgi:hypothetical protein